ncbi:MAG TPA: hypothetical protein VH164_11215, partial [Ktedonobacteraceae bacterium]|nr:hypothetical protein [Ktedonobacteraceae bacterium]
HPVIDATGKMLRAQEILANAIGSRAFALHTPSEILFGTRSVVTQHSSGCIDSRMRSHEYSWGV